MIAREFHDFLAGRVPWRHWLRRGNARSQDKAGQRATEREPNSKMNRPIVSPIQNSFFGAPPLVVNGVMAAQAPARRTFADSLKIGGRRREPR
jgi:hypothetical protein